MDSHNENGGFRYTYSAKEQEELKRIREKYEQPTEEENKLERLRRLDAGVMRKAQAVGLTLGIIGVLILGFGMSLCMTDLGRIFGPLEDWSMLIGIIVGIVGGVIASIAYPIHNAVLRWERKRVAPEILRLTDELMK